MLVTVFLTKRTFWFFATVFIFILATNWIGLIPGIGSIGWGHRSSHGFQLDEAWLRGANADVNLTLAMAVVFFACWIVWALQEVGPLGFLAVMALIRLSRKSNAILGRFVPSPCP